MRPSGSFRRRHQMRLRERRGTRSGRRTPAESRAAAAAPACAIVRSRCREPARRSLELTLTHADPFPDSERPTVGPGGRPIERRSCARDADSLSRRALRSVDASRHGFRSHRPRAGAPGGPAHDQPGDACRRPRAAGQPARRAARAPRPHRHQEGLRPGHVRRLHGVGRRPAGAGLPDPRHRRRGPRGHDDRGARRRRRSCTRCSGHSSSTTPSSAATARPGQIMSAVALLDEGTPAPTPRSRSG